MNQYVTGAVIKQLRENKKMTQLQLAEKLAVSDKTVSKWETGRGYPDISLLEPLAQTLGVSMTELISGETVRNGNVAANMLKSFFYVCPVCGNVLVSTGEAAVSCHGVQLLPLDAESDCGGHELSLERVEDEYYVHSSHEMTKSHYISFFAALGSDGVELKKLYPEQEAEARFKIRGTRKIFWYCNKDGLFCRDLLKNK